MFFNAVKESEDNLHKTLNGPHEDMYENPDTTSKVTGTSEAGCTCHPATPLLRQTIAVLISQVPQGN